MAFKRPFARLFRHPSLSPVAKAFLRELAARHWLQFVGFFFMSLVGTVLELTGVMLVFPFLIILVAPERMAAIPGFSAVIESMGISATTLPIVLIALIAAMLVGKNSYMLFFHWLTARTLV